ncbi:transglutaminase-like domain-containing protein [Clostridium sp. LBM24168]
MKRLYIPISILNVVLLVILASRAYSVVDIPYKYIMLLFIGTVAVFELINYILSKKKKTFLILLIIFIALSIFIGIYRYSYFIIIFNNMENRALKINDIVAVNSYVQFSLIYPFYFLVIPIITSIYLILFKLKKGVVVILINTFVMILYGLLEFDSAVKNVLFLYVFLVFISLNKYDFGKKSRENYGKRIIIYYIIISIVLSSIVFKFAPDRSGKEADNMEYKLSSMFNVEGTKIYNFSTIGINEGNISFLGKKLQMSNTKISLISGDVPKYLRTKVYYGYNHNRWIENIQLPIIIGKNILDVNSLVHYNVPNIADNSEFFKKNIKYNEENDIKIKTIFIRNLNNDFSNVMISPNYIKKVISNKNSYITMYDNENYLVGQNLLNYSIDYYDYTGMETFEKYMKSKYKNDINNIHGKVNINNVNYSLINNALSFTSSDRVKKLAYKITSKASNNTEKLKLIQNYLLSNYTYNLQPDPMGDNSPDYVDFFLFNEKRGYCMSFATAAVMLCRAAGIPARYVEGFKVSGKKDSKGRYILRSSDAHAWCEVLTSTDKGTWSILETTPRYEQGSVGNTNTTLPSGNIKSNNEKSQMRETQYNGRTKAIPKSQQKTEVKNKQKRSADKNYIHILGKVENYKYAVAIACISLICIVIKLLRKKFILKSIVYSESLIPLYTYLLKRLKTIGLVKKPYETDEEFAVRIRDTIDIELLVKALYREIYGNEKSNFNRSSIIIAVEKTVKNNINI